MTTGASPEPEWLLWKVGLLGPALLLSGMQRERRNGIDHLTERPAEDHLVREHGGVDIGTQARCLEVKLGSGLSPQPGTARDVYRLQEIVRQSPRRARALGERPTPCHVVVESEGTVKKGVSEKLRAIL
jgi:hypothetical protein